MIRGSWGTKSSLIRLLVNAVDFKNLKKNAFVLLTIQYIASSLAT
jgi:hypothetical protein